MSRRVTGLIILLFFSFIGFTQVKTIEAVKASEAPRIDGKLNDEAWKNAQPITDLQQFFPNPGSAPTMQFI
jgi:hypothetical protein